MNSTCFITFIVFLFSSSHKVHILYKIYWILNYALKNYLWWLILFVPKTWFKRKFLSWLMFLRLHTNFVSLTKTIHPSLTFTFNMNSKNTFHWCKMLRAEADWQEFAPARQCSWRQTAKSQSSNTCRPHHSFPDIRNDCKLKRFV